MSLSDKAKQAAAAAGIAASLAGSLGTDLLKADISDAASRERNTASAQLREREAETARTLRGATNDKGQPSTSGS